MSDRIHAAAAERDALLRKIADTQHAKAAVKQLTPQITTLTNKQYDAAQLYNELAAAMRKNEQAADKLRDHSSLRKFFHREKVAAESEKAEDLYIASIGWAKKAEVKLALVKKEIADLKQKREDLRAMDTAHNYALGSLDALYNSVFDGPTPGLPNEDALEATVTGAQECYDDVQARLSHAMAVANNLDKAHQSAQYAVTALGLALKASENDIFFMGPPVTVHDNGTAADTYSYNRHHDYDRTEREMLQSVNKSLAEAEFYVCAARQMDPTVAPALFSFTSQQVDDGTSSALGVIDRYLDNPVTDLLFHFKIKDGIDGVKYVEEVVRESWSKAEEKVAAIETEKKPVEAALDDGRKQLMDLRVEIFEKTLKGS
ncbi:hypothetical protein F503_07324 [Ophiostoma piceae UAMH 11346]|uniref:Uncharacterized protein n=1 Tax=Ophiostoma piceae (strain UAMH 11346) TaxID=1262450 RepID=S3CSC1_OPHP1|nr:hypothetical protein F503_07324 [Ophiostoma piceae UAMH 11346]